MQTILNFIFAISLINFCELMVVFYAFTAVSLCVIFLVSYHKLKAKFKTLLRDYDEYQKACIGNKRSAQNFTDREMSTFKDRINELEHTIFEHVRRIKELTDENVSKDATILALDENIILSELRLKALANMSNADKAMTLVQMIEYRATLNKRIRKELRKERQALKRAIITPENPS